MRRVHLVHGDIGSGKTRRAAQWVEAQELAGRTVAGALALKTAEGRRFQDIATGDERALEHPAPEEAALEMGRFRFRRAAFDWALTRIDAALASGASAVVIDEVGPLEMRGEGFADLLDRLARDRPDLELVLLVRTGLIDAVTDRFGEDAQIIFDPPRNLDAPRP